MTKLLCIDFVNIWIEIITGQLSPIYSKVMAHDSSWFISEIYLREQDDEIWTILHIIIIYFDTDHRSTLESLQAILGRLTQSYDP